MQLKTPANREFAIAMTLAAACWGFATVMSKGALAHIPPLTLLVVQLAVSITFLWAIIALQRIGLPRRRQALRLGLIGLLNPGIAYTFSLFGLTLTTASMSTLLWAAEPILILGLAWLILCERLTRPLIVFSTLAIVGVTLVAGINSNVASSSSLIGNLLVLAGVGCCALYTVLTRQMGLDYDPLLVVALQQTFAFGWALIIWPVEWLTGGLASLAAVIPGAWGWAVASGIFYYALAFWFYIVGLKKIPASLAGVFLNLIPIFGVGGAYVFLGERLAMAQWAGAILILAAVFGVLRWPRAKTIPAS